MKNLIKDCFLLAALGTILFIAFPACSAKKTSEVPQAGGVKEYGSDYFGEIPPWAGRNSGRVKISVAFAKGMTGIANQYAVEKGFYADAGIDLEQIDTTDYITALGSGEIDFADGDPGRFIPAIVNGVGLKIVGNMWRNKGAFWIIGNNKIQSIADLKGKTLGTGNATGGMRMNCLEILEQNGVDPKSVELIANGFYQNAYATLTSGQVDATIIHQPFAALAEREGNGHTLAKTWEYLPTYHTGVLAASTKIIEKNPSDLERLLEVYYFVNSIALAHLDEFIPWAAGYLNVDSAIANDAIKSELVLWENDPIVDISRLQVTEDLLFKHGMQKESFPVNNTVDNSFAEKLAQSLKLGKYAGK